MENTKQPLTPEYILRLMRSYNMSYSEADDLLGRVQSKITQLLRQELACLPLPDGLDDGYCIDDIKPSAENTGRK